MKKILFLVIVLGFLGIVSAAFDPVMVKDIYVGGDSSPANLTNINGTLFFSANNGVDGIELWKSDGTEVGTILVKDIWSGAASSSPADLTNINGTLFFKGNDEINGYELWKSDGTEIGTIMVKDIFTGVNSPQINNLTNVDGSLFFRANDGDYGLWKSDGTEIGTIKLLPTGYPDRLTDINGTLFLVVNGYGINGNELWKSDGTETGTVMVKNINTGGGSEPNYLTAYTGGLFFQATDGVDGIELWKSNGTEVGTVLVKDINTGGDSTPNNLLILNGVLFFSANDGVNGVELWKSDGTEVGTILVKDINTGAGSSSPSNLIDINGTLFFSANDGVDGIELWKSDGTEVGTILVKDINTGNDSNPLEFIELDGKLFFQANDGINGVELWKSDGTLNGTILIDVWTGSTISLGAGCTEDLNPQCHYSEMDCVSGCGGTWLGAPCSIDNSYCNESEVNCSSACGGDWSSGTGTIAKSSSPTNLININGELFFQANGVHGRELWKYDSRSLSYIVGFESQTNWSDVGLNSFDYNHAWLNLITIGNTYTFVFNYINDLNRTSNARDFVPTPFKFKYRVNPLAKSTAGNVEFNVKFFNK